MKITQGIVPMIAGVFLFMNPAGAQTAATNDFRAGYTAGNYYYYPEIDTWYDIPNSRFVYFENRRWVYSDMISHKYRYYDIANAYKVQVSEKKPYLHADAYRAAYIDYYTAYQNRFRNRGVLATARMDNDDRSNIHRPIINNRSAIKEHRRIEEGQTFENKTAKESKTYIPAETPVTAEPAKSEEVYQPEFFEVHKPVERAKTESTQKTDRLRIDSKKDIRAKEENRARVEPLTKEPVAPVKVQEPVKMDSVPVIIRLPGGTREAQYSDKFKKKVEGQ